VSTIPNNERTEIDAQVLSLVFEHPSLSQQSNFSIEEVTNVSMKVFDEQCRLLVTQINSYAQTIKFKYFKTFM
jgi:hypothetical protein